MKKIKIIVTMLIICGTMSCKDYKNNNIQLPDFTQEIISTYINDTNNLSAKNRKDEIILISTTDTQDYCLSIFANDPQAYKYCRNDFVGQILYLGHKIRIFGDQTSIFYSVQELKPQKPCNNEFIEYDPNVWQICLNKDLSFNKMRSFKVNPNENISIIKNIVEKHFKPSYTTNNKIDSDIYPFSDVEIPPQFKAGEDSLRDLISSNFNVKRKNIDSKVIASVGVVVDKEGNAILDGIIKSSNDIEIDNEALRVAQIITQYKFNPASHRGEKVNSIYPIMFLKKDILP